MPKPYITWSWHYLELAEGQLVALVKLRPASPHVQEMLAVMHLIYGRHSEAQVCLKKALDKDPANPKLRYIMGYCLAEQERYAEAATQLPV